MSWSVLGQRGVVAGGALVALLALRAVGADGVAVGVGQELAVQRPVPVAVFGLRGTYLRGVALVTLVALRAVVDGDGGRFRKLMVKPTSTPSFTTGVTAVM